jgi:hypothetical protein
MEITTVPLWLCPLAALMTDFLSAESRFVQTAKFALGCLPWSIARMTTQPSVRVENGMTAWFILHLGLRGSKDQSLAY